MNAITTHHQMYDRYRSQLHLIRETDEGLRYLLLTPHGGIARVETWRFVSQRRHITLWRQTGVERASREDLAFVAREIKRTTEQMRSEPPGKLI